MSTPINENIEVPKSTTFQTGVNIVVNKSKVTLPPLPSAHQKCPSFFDAVPPTYNPNSLSLPIPVDLFKIKKNATNSLTKVKFSHLLQNPQLNELVDALISDSFWRAAHRLPAEQLWTACLTLLPHPQVEACDPEISF